MDKKLSYLDFEIGALYRDDYLKKLLLTDLSKALKINHRTAKLHVEKLEKYRIFDIEKKGKFLYIYPSLKEDFFKFMVMTEIHVFLKDKRPIIKEIARLCRNNKFCIVFGSYASYTESDVSDIDIVTNKEVNDDNLFVEVQNFKYLSLKKIPDKLFREILKNHIILKGYEEFVYEVMRRYGYK